MGTKKTSAAGKELKNVNDSAIAVPLGHVDRGWAVAAYSPPKSATVNALNEQLGPAPEQARSPTYPGKTALPYRTKYEVRAEMLL